MVAGCLRQSSFLEVVVPSPLVDGCGEARIVAVPSLGDGVSPVSLGSSWLTPHLPPQL